MRIDSSGNVGIGTSSPTFQSGTGLEISRSGTASLRVERTGATASSGEFFAGNGQVVVNSVSNTPLIFRTNNTDRMRIDSSGNVGIGTSSPLQALHVNSGTGNSAAIFESTDATSQIWLKDSASSSTYQTGIACYGDNLLLNNGGERLRIDSSGRVGIGTSSPNQLIEIRNASGSFGAEAVIRGSLSAGLPKAEVAIKRGSSGDGAMLVFRPSDSSGNLSEAMRIDSSGNLLVGKASSNSNVVGVEFRPSGRIFGCVDDNSVGVFNRKTSDGDVILIRKDNSTVGSIGNSSTNLIVEATASNRSGLSFGGSVTPRRGGANSDNTTDLGVSSIRFKDLYLGGGVYLGGTGSANKLDDYEEGTFTPTITGSGGNPTVTYDTTYTGGRYTRIGNLVYINAEIRCTSISGGSGQLGMAGMPFARNGNYKSDASPTTTQLYNVTYSGFVTANIARSSSTYEFVESNSGSATSSILISDLSASPIFILRVNGVYDVS
jgi:hypothetical protein